VTFDTEGVLKAADYGKKCPGACCLTGRGILEGGLGNHGQSMHHLGAVSFLNRKVPQRAGGSSENEMNFVCKISEISAFWRLALMERPEKVAFTVPFPTPLPLTQTCSQPWVGLEIPEYLRAFRQKP
jgi:hypothetical protein